MSSFGNRSLAIVVAVMTLVGGACGGDDQTVEVAGAWARSSPAAVSTGAVYMDLTASQADRLLSVSVSPDVADQAQIHEVVAADHTANTDHDAIHQSDDTDHDAIHQSDDTDHDAMHQGDDTDHDAMHESDDTDHDAIHDEEMGSMSEAVTMRELTDGLELPANTTVKLAPGSYHIMLIDLVKPLAAGDTFEVDLSFESGPESVMVTVADRAP